VLLEITRIPAFVVVRGNTLESFLGEKQDDRKENRGAEGRGSCHTNKE